MSDESRKITTPAMAAMDPLARIEAMLEKQNDRSVWLEAIFEKGAEENRRQFGRLEEQMGATKGSLIILQGELVELRKRQDGLDTAQKHTREEAATATRLSRDSIAEVHGISTGLIAHVERLEGERRADMDAERKRREGADRARASAASVSAEHFKKVYDALENLGETQSERSKKASRERLLLGALAIVVTVLASTVLQGMQIMYSPARQVTEVPK